MAKLAITGSWGQFSMRLLLPCIANPKEMAGNPIRPTLFQQHAEVPKRGKSMKMKPLLALSAATALFAGTTLVNAANTGSSTSSGRTIKSQGYKKGSKQGMKSARRHAPRHQEKSTTSGY
jgi:hypothetical protein